MANGAWTTKDGREIPVAQMTNDHLVNAIRFLARRSEEFRFRYIQDGFSVAAMLQGEMAIDAVERDVDSVSSMDTEELIAAMGGNRLLAEAAERNLEWRDG